MTCEWLLACYKYAKRLPVKNFLVGDSISPVDDVPDTELIDAVEPEFEPELLPFENAAEDEPERMPNAGELQIEPIRF